MEELKDTQDDDSHKSKVVTCASVEEWIIRLTTQHSKNQGREQNDLEHHQDRILNHLKSLRSLVLYERPASKSQMHQDLQILEARERVVNLLQSKCEPSRFRKALTASVERHQRPSLHELIEDSTKCAREAIKSFLIDQKDEMQRMIAFYKSFVPEECCSAISSLEVVLKNVEPITMSKLPTVMRSLQHLRAFLEQSLRNRTDEASTDNLSLTASSLSSSSAIIREVNNEQLLSWITTLESTTNDGSSDKSDTGPLDTEAPSLSSIPNSCFRLALLDDPGRLLVQTTMDDADAVTQQHLSQLEEAIRDLRDQQERYNNLMVEWTSRVDGMVALKASLEHDLANCVNVDGGVEITDEVS